MKQASLLIHPEELSEEWIDRLVQNRIPTLGLHPVGGKHAHRSLADLMERMDDPAFCALLDKAHERGLRIEYEMHAARFLLPADEFEAHPEWFRMNDEGQRTPDYNCCASNDEALDAMAEKAAQTAKKLRHGTHRYFLWLDDAKDAACRCSACRALSPSDQQLKILNRIVARLRKDDPEATLAYLAYFRCVQPPQQIKPALGIFLEYAPFERDFHRPLREQEQALPLPRLLAVFGAKTAKALDYWYDNSLFSKWKKPPQPFAVDREVLKDDAAFYRSLGIEDLSSFACYLGKDYEELYGAPDVSAFGQTYNGQL